MDGGQVRVRSLCCRQESLVHGRDTQEERAGQAALSCQYQRSVELGEHGDRRPQAQARQEANRETEGVEEGQDAVENLGALVEDGNPRDRLLDVRRQVRVGESGGLWYAGRATRVDEESDVLHRCRAVAAPWGRGAQGARPGASPARARAGELFALLAGRLDGKLERHARGRGQSRR